MYKRQLLDGYAFWAEDARRATGECPRWLRILEEVPAGQWPKYPLLSGTATKILTGAPIPEGANAVVRFEDVLLEGDKVGINEPFLPESNISRAGEEIKKGECGLHKGTVITPGAAGMLASSVSYTHLDVYKRQYFTSLKDNFDIPVIGWLLRQFRCISVGQTLEERKLFLREAARILRAGNLMAVYPEGELQLLSLIHI